MTTCSTSTINPGADQPGDDGTDQPAWHAPTDQALPDQAGDGPYQEQDEQMR